MNKIVIIILAILFHSCAHQPRQPAECDKPNILFLLADDLGYGELGCYGQDLIKTPVIDELAKQGIRFTDFYAGSPLCSPSRAVIMTGKHSGINTIRGNIGYYPEQTTVLTVFPLGRMKLPLVKCCVVAGIKRHISVNGTWMNHAI
jgi:hypothetical protein